MFVTYLMGGFELQLVKQLFRGPMIKGLQLTTDADYLRLLRVLHYIWGTVCCLWGLVGVAYIWAGESAVKHFERGPAEGNIPLIFGQLFVTSSILLVVLLEICGVLSLFAARKYGLGNGYRACFAAAIVNCILIPVGTAMGVFALLVLNRPSVRAAFSKRDQSPANC
jgi:hypothetical protein